VSESEPSSGSVPDLDPAANGDGHASGDGQADPVHAVPAGRIAIGPPPPLPRFNPEMARRFLRHVIDPAVGVIELRVWRAGWDRSGFIVAKQEYAATLAGWYDNADDLICDLGKLEGVSGYLTINPVRRDLIARSCNKIKKVKDTTRDIDVAVYRWLYIDPDPRRPARHQRHRRGTRRGRRDARHDLARRAGDGSLGDLGAVRQRRLDTRPTAGLRAPRGRQAGPAGAEVVRAEVRG
jgi:hypothetical protein